MRIVVPKTPLKRLLRLPNYQLGIIAGLLFVANVSFIVAIITTSSEVHNVRVEASCPSGLRSGMDGRFLMTRENSTLELHLFDLKLGIGTQDRDAITEEKPLVRVIVDQYILDSLCLNEQVSQDTSQYVYATIDFKENGFFLILEDLVVEIIYIS